jgi:hypothetical protein
MPFLLTDLLHPLQVDATTFGCSQAGTPINAKTLGEAIAMAANRFRVRIVPHGPPKCFRVYDLPGASDEYLLVEIHVVRDGQILIPEQNLAFRLFDADIVDIGVLAV